MKELSFRAWHKKEKWMDGVWAWDIEHGLLCFTKHSEALLEDCVLMQSTGILDKNGREIYEGDICYPIPRKDSLPGVVKFQRGRFLYACAWGNWDLVTDGLHPTKKKRENLVVIGNIYENTELLHKVNGVGL